MEVLKRLNDKSLFILSLLMTIVGSYFSYGFLHPDEQYYAIDFAAFKAGLIPEITTWEYSTKLRPWLLPAIFTPFLKLFKLMDFSPFTMAWMLRLISGIFSWWALVRLNKKLKDHFPGSISYNIFVFFTHFSFFCFFMQLRTSSENWSTAFLVFAFSLLLRKAPYLNDFIFGGLFLGLAFSIRHQTGLIALGFGLWLLIVKQIGFKNWFGFFVPSILAGVLIGIGADWWGYGELTFTPWNYIYQNLVLDKISQFGTSPFYAYFIWLFKTLTPFWAIIILIGFIRLLMQEATNWVVWSVFPFILVHFFIGHKELRFLYPVVPFLLYSGAQFFPERKLSFEPLRRYFYLGTVYLNMILFVYLFFKPAYTPLGFYKYLYDNDIREIRVFKNKQGQVPTLEMPFYKKEDLNVVIDSGLAKTGYFFTTKYAELDYFTGGNCETLYSTYPEWLFQFNYFGWLKRSSIWILTKCQ
ncbi:MAG: hypothetical protein CME70_04120 [Halobacteriovorax sp.]|nr:hypothetical protein [Halobacteriovorax sp.]|tara:strand:- start:84858 stop:86261 length:1404 start_codon:yes stop_codon:yes gene_type:complete